VDHWFHGDGTPDKELLEDAKAFGIILAEPEPAEFAIWPENLETVQLFIDCQTQWRTTGSGVIGLDYGVVLALASLSGATDPLALLRDLQVMEMRARELINQEASKE
jgi:hypothetical protein